MDEIKDYIDWDKVPHWVQFVAVDDPEAAKRFFDSPFGNIIPDKFNRHGVGVFELNPHITNGNTWECDGREGLASKDAIIGSLPPWRESLCQRPKKDAV